MASSTASVPLQILGGTTTQIANYKGSDRELVVNIDNYSLYVMDGLTYGGHSISGGGGSGTVTSVSITSANGISGTVATATTTPAITLSLGAITPTSIVASGSISGSNLSGTNTGDQTNITGSAGSFTGSLSGDVTGTQSATAISNATVTGKLLTGFSASAGTITSSDSILTAFNKIAGNIAGYATTSGTLAQFAATTSAQLAGVISDETGSGLLVFNNSPTFITPILGAATATTINKLTITAPATSATLTIVDGKTLTSNNTLTFTGTDSSSVAFGTGGTVAYTANKLSVFAATTSSELAGVISDETGSGALVFANTPTLVTPVLGAATATSVNGTSIPTSKTLVVTTDTLAVHAATTSAQLAGVISDETGTGSLVFANSPVLVTPNLGTPSTLVGTNITGTATSFTASNVTTNANLTGAITSVGNATSLGSFSSSNLSTALSDKTGTGVNVFATSPSLVTPDIGVATANTINKVTITAPATGATLTLADGVTLTVTANSTISGSVVTSANNYSGNLYAQRNLGGM